MITAYALAFGSLLLLGGRIADLFGRKWTFIVGLLGFAGASALGGAASSFAMLFGARALQGVFGALLAPAALSLLTTTFTDPKERGKAFGIYAAIAGMGGAIGLLLGGALTEDLDWRWCLYVSIVFAVPAALAGAPAAACTARAVAAAARRARRLLASPACSRSCSASPAPRPTAGATPSRSPSWRASALLLVAFVLLAAPRRAAAAAAAHRRRPRPRRARSSRSASRARACSALFLFLTYYLQVTKGFTAIETGLAFLPMSLSIAPTVAIVSTRILPRTARARSSRWACCTAAPGMAAADPDRRRHRATPRTCCRRSC